MFTNKRQESAQSRKDTLNEMERQSISSFIRYGHNEPSLSERDAERFASIAERVTKSSEVCDAVVRAVMTALSAERSIKLMSLGRQMEQKAEGGTMTLEARMASEKWNNIMNERDDEFSYQGFIKLVGVKLKMFGVSEEMFKESLFRTSK